MTDFYQKITEMQGGLEDLVRRVPGIKQMLEREDQRAADELLREHLVRAFEEQLTRVDALKQRLVQSGGIAYMERAQQIDTKLRTFIDRVKTAAEGYSGIWATVKVDSEALQRVYNFDAALFQYQDQLATGLNEMENALNGEGMDTVLSQLDAIVTEANNTFKRRVEAIMGLQDSV